MLYNEAKGHSLHNLRDILGWTNITVDGFVDDQAILKIVSTIMTLCDRVYELKVEVEKLKKELKKAGIVAEVTEQDIVDAYGADAKE